MLLRTKLVFVCQLLLLSFIFTSNANVANTPSTGETSLQQLNKRHAGHNHNSSPKRTPTKKEATPSASETSTSPSSPVHDHDNDDHDHHNCDHHHHDDSDHDHQHCDHDHQHCDHDHDHSDPVKAQASRADVLSKGEVWLYTLVSITAVNALAFLGIAFIPLMRRSKFLGNFILKLFVSLSVGVLIGDAVLHLIPEAFGAHSHGPEEDSHDHGSHSHHAHISAGAVLGGCGGHSHGHDEAEKMKTIWLGTCMIAGIYLFYLFEHGLRVIHVFREKRRQQPGKLSNEGGTKASPAVKPVAWLILFGDAMHNLVDGLLIGATFAGNFKTGLATTLAVFLHEIPHELGDFSVLVSSGVGFLRAACYHFVANLTAYVGGVIGIVVGDTFSARPWILAFTAGNFLYIAMCDLIPELNGGSSHYHHHGHSHSHFVSPPTTQEHQQPTSECNSASKLEGGAHPPQKQQDDHDHGVGHSTDWAVTNTGIVLGVFIMWAIAVWGE